MSVEDPSQQNKSTFQKHPHYFQWGLTAFCVIVSSAVVVFLLQQLVLPQQVYHRRKDCFVRHDLITRLSVPLRPP